MAERMKENIDGTKKKEYQPPTIQSLSLREAALQNLTLDARNALGHWTDCPHWDWADFSKCNCADGIANVPAVGRAYVPSPIPLRDHFAATASVPWDDALALAAAEAGARIALGGQPTLAEVVFARVRLRYLEADAMIEHRKHAPREAFEAGQERGKNYGESLNDEDPSNWICECGHEPESHNVADDSGAPGPCTMCDCATYKRRPVDQKAEPS